MNSLVCLHWNITRTAVISKWGYASAYTNMKLEIYWQFYTRNRSTKKPLTCLGHFSCNRCLRESVHISASNIKTIWGLSQSARAHACKDKHIWLSLAPRVLQQTHEEWKGQEWLLWKCFQTVKIQLIKEAAREKSHPLNSQTHICRNGSLVCVWTVNRLCGLTY